MISKHKHILNSQIVGSPIMSRFKNRGKFNRMWNFGSITISDIVHVLYTHYKHLIEKQQHDTPEKIKANINETLFD